LQAASANNQILVSRRLDIQGGYIILINIVKIIQKEEVFMAKIKIKDLPLDLKVSEEELRKITGGFQVYTIAHDPKCNCTELQSRRIMPTLLRSGRSSPLIRTGF
jgi:hypothetical protein